MLLLIRFNFIDCWLNFFYLEHIYMRFDMKSNIFHFDLVYCWFSIRSVLSESHFEQSEFTSGKFSNQSEVSCKQTFTGNKTAANNVKNSKRKQLFQILTIHWCWGSFKMINSLFKKADSQTICLQKIRLDMTVYLQILIQSYT